MDTLRKLVGQLRTEALSHEEAMRQIVDFVFWNSRSTDKSPFKHEFRELEAEGLLSKGFYKEVIKRWEARNRAWS